jgi:hypothetical protein
MKARPIPLFMLVFTGLLTLSTLAASPPDHDAALQELMESYRKAEVAFFEPLNKAKTDAERQKIQIDFNKHPAKEYIPKFQALAKEAKGTQAGAKALVQILTLSQRGNSQQAGKEALDALMADYIKSPEMAQAVSFVEYGGSFLGEQKVVGLLQRLMNESPDRNVKAAATFALGNVYMSPYSGIRADHAKAKKYLQIAIRQYAGTPYAKRASSALFQLENLSVGKVAPEITGTDENGRPIKLSDFRGKVVVLDFWGFW